jgi:hypothetical protein
LASCECRCIGRHFIAIPPSNIWLFADECVSWHSRISSPAEAIRRGHAAYLRTNPAVNAISLLRANALSTHPVYMAQRERLYEGMRRVGMPEE